MKPTNPFKKRYRDDDTVSVKIPKEFLRVVDLRTGLDNFNTRQDFLRDLSKKLKPKIKDYKGMFDEEDE